MEGLQKKCTENGAWRNPTCNDTKEKGISTNIDKNLFKKLHSHGHTIRNRLRG